MNDKEYQKFLKDSVKDITASKVAQWAHFNHKRLAGAKIFLPPIWEIDKEIIYSVQVETIRVRGLNDPKRTQRKSN